MFTRKKKSTRRIVREKVLQILYAYEFNKENLQALIHATFSDIENIEDREFGEALANKSIIHSKEFDEMINTRAQNWELSRMAVIDHLILRIGICEFIYFPEIPPKVTINEMIDIVKEFSTLQSNKFVNGVLDSILEHLKKEGKLRKSGRGLMEESLFKSSNDE